MFSSKFYTPQVELVLLIFFNILPFIYSTSNKQCLEPDHVSVVTANLVYICAFFALKYSKKCQVIRGDIWPISCRHQWVNNGNKICGIEKKTMGLNDLHHLDIASSCSLPVTDNIIQKK